MTEKDSDTNKPAAAGPRAASVIDLSTPSKRKKARSTAKKSKAQGTTLCKRGFHKWTDEPKKQFDVKQGRLVSIRRCRRCGAQKTLTS